jgi:hypothetical protein
LYDDVYTVNNVKFYNNTGCATAASGDILFETDGLSDQVYDNDDFTITNDTKAQTIRCITYTVNGIASGSSTTSVTYKFNNVDYADFFKIDGGDAWRVYANK